MIPIWFLTLFVRSIIYASEQPIDFISANIIAAVVMAGATWWLGRKMRLATKTDTGLVGMVWVVTVVVVLVVVAFGNRTPGIVFSNWSVYLTYVGILVGTFLARRKEVKA
ncbi:MAG: hypothetical protein HYY50_02660 [Candidatus Kerfeldbacteria bacterium]|nr:hypothetical protein [Candidatus Kerfeldbacteria bacterium]